MRQHEPLPSWLAEIARLSERREITAGEQLRRPEPADLPEVQELQAEGWYAVEGGLWLCLAGVWPAAHRCWVPDRLPRVVNRVMSDGRRFVEPRVALDDEHITATAAECGLAMPPPGRLWLLRSPWPSLGLATVGQLLLDRCLERGLRWTTPDAIEVARELLPWPQEQVWDWWTGPMAEVARAWRAVGRAGEDVVALVSTRLGPRELDQLAAAAGLDEDQAVAWALAVSAGDRAPAGGAVRAGDRALDVVQRVISWRALGLPAHPPASPALHEMLPTDAAAWLDAGLTLEDACLRALLRPAEALAWRAAGFGTEEMRELLLADDVLTPQEARAFDVIGVGGAERLAWVESGFDAETARLWAALGVRANEARVWRSTGRSPEDAGPAIAATGGLIPADVAFRWADLGATPHGYHYTVTDPPSTRGRLARLPR